MHFHMHFVACHISCQLSCSGAGPEGCDECKTGYRMEESICKGEWACVKVGVCVWCVCET